MTPLAILLIAAALIITLTRDWNAYEGGRAEQRTDDAYVRGDLTPLSTRVPGIVKQVLVSDYQKVHSGDLLVCFTDGITEPENEYGEMYGEEQLKDLIVKYGNTDSSEIIARTMEAVNHWTKSPELQDDMTMVVARRI